MYRLRSNTTQNLLSLSCCTNIYLEQPILITNEIENVTKSKQFNIVLSDFLIRKLYHISSNKYIQNFFQNYARFKK